MSLFRLISKCFAMTPGISEVKAYLLVMFAGFSDASIS